ncbi:MAG: flagellar hook-basal body complex protein FliE [Succinivibrio sp.]
MSLSVNGLGTTSMMAQLQRMQQQMRTLSMATAGNIQQTQQVQDNPVYLSETSSVSGAAAVKEPDNVGAFANMLNQAFETVNNLQNDSSNKQTRFDLGDRSMTLSDVMIASQKASLSFDATLQVRNKMIEAYKTISQMQI